MWTASTLTRTTRRREERGCGPVTGKDRASCQSGGAPALRPGAVAPNSRWGGAAEGPAVPAGRCQEPRGKSDPTGALHFVGGRWALPAEEPTPRSLLPKPTQSRHPCLVDKGKAPPSPAPPEPPRPHRRSSAPGNMDSLPLPPICFLSQVICCLSFGVWLTSLSIMSEFSSCLRPSHAPLAEHTPFCLS